MKYNLIKSVSILLFLILNNLVVYGQQSQEKPVIHSSVISFSDIIKYDKDNPAKGIKLIGNYREDKDEEVLPSYDILDSTNVLKDPYGKIVPPNNIKAVSLLSTSPSLTFNALDDNNTTIPPDVNGAVGPNHVMTTLNSQVRIQSLTGTIISTVTLNSFWASVGNPSTFDPKILYEPFNNRWIFTAAANGFSANSALLIGVSQTNDPTGIWNLYSIDADATNTNWFDFPSLGFNKNWIVVSGNIFANAGGFVGGKVYIFKKADLYAHVVSPITTVLSPGDGYGLSPAATYDNSISTLYLLQRINGNFSGSGYLNLYSITGAFGSETLSLVNQFSTPNPWSSSASLENSAPQSGTTQKIAANDDRMQNTVYRNGNIWGVHTVFLPAGAPTRSSVQWWQISTVGAILQRGRIDDGSSAQHFAFPSIAVNTNNDALIGYSKFSSSIFASSCYAMRASLDPVNTLQSEFLFKAGLAPYFKIFGGTSNRWGDYSATMTDPSGADFWTLQEYASFASGGSDRWGTWWAKVPTCTPSPTTVSIAASPSGVICSGTNVTFTATPTNPGLFPVYQWKKSLVNVGTNSPIYTDNALVTGNQITCVMTSSFSCATGNPATSNPIPINVNIVNDGNACTIDVCNTSSGTVTHTPVSINDGNACTTDFCNTSSGAVTHTTVNISDGNICTTDACNTSTGAITHTTQTTDDGLNCTTDGCNSITGIFHTAVNCGPALNANIMIEGFYSGGGFMQISGTGCLNNIDNVNHPNTLDVDTIFISAMDPVFPNGEVGRRPGILKTNGNISVLFDSPVIIGNNYYLKVNHRNSLETWSAAPVQLNAVSNYSFSSSLSQSFPSGIGNEVLTFDNLYAAIYSGDINQDKTIDISDFLELDPKIQNGDSGYDAGDLNGDGSVDISDFLLLDPNVQGGFGSATP